MWRALMSSRFASWVVGKVSLPRARQQQQELDLQRLYILTELHKSAVQGKPANMQRVLLESQALEPSSIKRDVQAALQLQVIGVAEALHDILLQAGDTTTAAAALTAAHRRAERRRERNASGLSKLIRGLTGGGSASRERAPGHPGPSNGTGTVPQSASATAATTTATTTAAAASCLNQAGSDAGGDGVSPGVRVHGDSGSSSSGGGAAAATASPAAAETVPDGDCGGGSGGGARRLSAAQLGEALQLRMGFSLELRPSTVPHPEAGTGLFLRGEARPGAVVAIFPGVLYGRTQLALMPNFPKVDTDNPYLSCRYDQSIVDSKPWGRGDPGVGAPSLGPSRPETTDVGFASSATASTSQQGISGDTSPSATASSSGSSSAAARFSGSSGGPSLGSGDGGSRPWWTWAGPLSSALSYLEGRHPLALAHFVNHPGGKGQAPNVLEASLDLPLDHPALLAASARPWLRAYLPTLQPPLEYDPYGDDTDEDEDSDGENDDDDGKDGKDGRAGVAGGSLPGELRPEALLSPPGGVVRLLVLVATRALKDGEELLQNYRMNPHMARPDWYVVHDAEAEQRRWAKVRALDLGFKGKRGDPVSAASPGGDTSQKGDRAGDGTTRR